MSNGAQRRVDYLDLKLNLPERMQDAVEAALHRMEDEYDAIQVEPKLKNGVLKINSYDVSPFLGFLNTQEWTELDQRRFVKEIENQLSQLLIKSLNADYQYHYRWCLGALKQLPLGRFL